MQLPEARSKGLRRDLVLENLTETSLSELRDPPFTHWGRDLAL